MNNNNAVPTFIELLFAPFSFQLLLYVAITLLPVIIRFYFLPDCSAALYLYFVFHLHCHQLPRPQMLRVVEFELHFYLLLMSKRVCDYHDVGIYVVVLFL